MKTLTLRLDDDDYKLFADFAAAEDMPLSMLIRRVMRQHIKGSAAPIQPPSASIATPDQEPRSMLNASISNNELLLSQLDQGRTLRDVAAEHGLQVQDVQTRASKARTARMDGTLTRERAMLAFLADNPKPGDDFQLRVVRDGGEYVFSWAPTGSGAASRVHWNEVDRDADEPQSAQSNTPAADFDDLLTGGDLIRKEVYNDPEALGKLTDAKFAEAAARFGWKL